MKLICDNERRLFAVEQAGHLVILPWGTEAALHVPDPTEAGFPRPIRVRLDFEIKRGDYERRDLRSTNAEAASNICINDAHGPIRFDGPTCRACEAIESARHSCEEMRQRWLSRREDSERCRDLNRRAHKALYDAGIPALREGKHEIIPVEERIAMLAAKAAP